MGADAPGTLFRPHLAHAGACYGSPDGPAKMSTSTQSQNLRKLFLIVGIGMTLSAAAAVVFLLTASGPGGVFGAELQLTGATSPWEAPPFAAAPVKLAGDRWLSVPARGADGTIFGLVRGPDGGALVKLDEATGDTIWRTSAGPGLGEFTRDDGWRLDEKFPALPLALAGDGVYLVAWQRAWALVAAKDGAIVKAGALTEAMPPVSAEGGACQVADGFWISLEDGRDGGVTLSAAGVLGEVRSERPSNCRRSGGGGGVFMASPLQNARAATELGFPTEICAETRKGRIIRENANCTDLRSDGDPAHAMLLRRNDPVIRDGDDWRLYRIPPGSAEYADIVGYELAWPHVFLSMAAWRHVTVTNDPAPTSFAPKRVENSREARESVGCMSREGKLLWQRTLHSGPYVPLGGEVGHQQSLAQHRSLLLASHRDSPVQSIYVVKPGMLLAVDQATGAPRFQVGAPLPTRGVTEAGAPPGP